ncbi:MAG: hypothetical protein HYX47_12020 [Burkholderiales bacterium]|nr:hypothetical protein [Burkholderiales bacterium]
MHPSHQAVADTIDAMNKSPYALRSGASSPGESVTRDQVLTALASQPDGLTATGVCEAIIGRNDARTAHRICAVFVRETKRGFIEPDAGRNAKRKLTERGLEVARELERTAPQRAAQARTAARATERERAQLASRTVNGVFDYAHKIHMGALG